MCTSSLIGLSSRRRHTSGSSSWSSWIVSSRGVTFSAWLKLFQSRVEVHGGERPDVIRPVNDGAPTTTKADSAPTVAQRSSPDRRILQTEPPVRHPPYAERGDFSL